MEIRSNNPQPERNVVERSRVHARALRQELARLNTVETAEESPNRTDRVDLSEHAQALREVVAHFDDEDVDREDVQTLKRLYESGRLNSPERMQAAAARLLGGEG